MKIIFTTFFLLLFMLTTSQYSTAQTCSDGAYQWSDMVDIFDNSGCNSSGCHGGSASGLDLTAYAGFNTGGTKCADEISVGTTLVDIIVSGGVSCANGDVMNPMNNFVPSPVAQADLDALQAWVNSGAFEFCRGTPSDDGYPECSTTIGAFAAPAETTICTDGSNLPALALPTASLPNVQIVVEINGTLVTVSDDGSFDTSLISAGDEVCYTAFNYDLAAIQALLETANGLCPTLDILFPELLPCVPIGDLIAGTNDGTPGLNDLLEVLDFAASLSAPITSVQSATSVLEALNGTISPLNLGPICYATSNNVCLTVEECVIATCPVVYLNDDNLPSLPDALCEGELLSLCFDLLVDDTTFDPSLVEFNYQLTFDGVDADVTLQNSFSAGTQIDPNANGQICFETIIPEGPDPCQSFDISLTIESVFYRDDATCPSNNIGFSLNLSVLPASDGDDLNGLVPLLGLAGFNPLTLTGYPNPNWTATVTQAPSCDGSTLGVVELYASNGTLCDTVSDLGTAGADGECPANNGELPEYTYLAFETFVVPDQNEMDSIVVNPCAVNIVVPAQTITCVENCGPCSGDEVAVTFSVDMSCSGTTARPPSIAVPFNGYLVESVAMTDDDGDDIWDGIVCAVPGTQFEYKYVIENFVEEENLVDDAQGGASCTYNTDSFSYSNRLITIPAGDSVLPTDAYGICGTCDNLPISIIFTVDMACSGVDPSTEIAITGPFNGWCDGCATLTDSDGDGVWERTFVFPPDDTGCYTVNYLYQAPNWGNAENFLTNGEDLATCENIFSDGTDANRSFTICEDIVTQDYWNACSAPAEPATGCDDGVCSNGVETWDGCACISGTAGEIPVCDDGDCANGVETYNEATCSCDSGTAPVDSGCDDGDCSNGVETWNGCECVAGVAGEVPMCDDGDCSNGVETYDAANCVCVAGTAPVDPGCDDGDCNNGIETWDGCECVAGETPVNPGCDDGDCSNGIEMWDGCECVAGESPVDPGCDDGDCSNGVETWDGCECVAGVPGETPDCDDGNCANGLEVYNAATCSCDSGTPPDDSCPEDTCFELYTWDTATCACITAVVDYDCNDNNECTTDSVDDTTCACVNEPIEGCGAVEGCTDACADNFDATATVDDGSCASYDTTCNTDCTMGDITVWDATLCSCEIETLVIVGCTDTEATNFDPNANCNDGCVYDDICTPPTPGVIDCE